MNRLDRLNRLLAERGPAGTLLHLLRRMSSELGRYRPSQLQDRRVRAAREARFDAEHAVATAGDARLSKLTIASSNRRFGVDYRGVDREEFARSFAELSIPYQEFTFVDLGSGKGRALILAAAFPFRRLIGVEFAPELHEIAKANLLGRQDLAQQSPRFLLHCMDATEFEFPPGPLVIFLYNPFGPEVMEKVAQRLYQSYAATPRPIYVVYINPFHIGPWQALGFHIFRTGDPFVILVPPQ